MAHDLLFPAVLTNSSERELGNLVHEVREISDVDRFDLIVARRSDLRRFGIVDANGDAFQQMAQVIADAQLFEVVRKNLMREVEQHEICVSALATYFPGITAASGTSREMAIDALTNTVTLAIDLVEEERMEHAIVEIVCGTVIDPGSRAPNDPRRNVFSQDWKLDLLCQSLTAVIAKVRGQRGEAAAFTLALELEPGETYVLNNIGSIRGIIDRIEGGRKIDLPGMNIDWLRDHVGLNLDIGHMRIAKVAAAELEPYLDRLVHAHVADHPGMHTHDQVVGSWTYPGHLQRGYYEYLDLLLKRADSASASQKKSGKPLPFSRTVALELEGSNRIFWIHDSLARLKHLIRLATARHRGGSGPQAAARPATEIR
jgi:hypothetical protein